MATFISTPDAAFSTKSSISILFVQLTTSRGHFVHLGDSPLCQTMFTSFNLQALATSRSPEISVTIICV